MTDQRISRVLPRADGGHRDAGWKLGCQVLEGMDRKVDAPIQKGIVDLFGEQRPASDL